MKGRERKILYLRKLGQKSGALFVPSFNFVIPFIGKLKKKNIRSAWVREPDECFYYFPSPPGPPFFFAFDVQHPEKRNEPNLLSFWYIPLCSRSNLRNFQKSFHCSVCVVDGEGGKGGTLFNYLEGFFHHFFPLLMHPFKRK